jgi:glycine cleavage system H protein
MEFPQDLYYTKDHEWLRVEPGADVCKVGITEFAQSELGDIVYVEVDEMDSELSREDAFGTVEAVKTVAELFMPVSGTVIELNAELENTPELVNDDPYGEGWLIKIKLSNPDEVSDLMSASDYSDMVAG